MSFNSCMGDSVNIVHFIYIDEKPRIMKRLNGWYIILHLSLLPPVNEVWGKVMFFLGVCHEFCSQGGLLWGVSALGEVVCSRGGGCQTETLQFFLHFFAIFFCIFFPLFFTTHTHHGQWAGDMHPTGMHSCFHWIHRQKYYYCSQTKFAKVMFLQVSVCPQGACMVGGGVHGRGACMAGGHAWQGGMHGRGHPWQGEGMHGRGHVWQGVCIAEGACMAGEIATAAGSTHPTGMHSCI